ncbi:general transcription and DNA repair factor IIH subunit TFB1-3-like [Magnolia sinica]|uniref:general transcription and DNA repair factor IIH subunit TFB1-3-like n=1 Tax=Magnolia sinica TaxID=86752 RepID=UPI002657E8DA|nr:general transcription and DNA repair factor IIH subunit TFB1-3-like [Magnolia sinica]
MFQFGMQMFDTAGMALTSQSTREYGQGLTLEWLQMQIFTEKPAMHQAFLNFVPSKKKISGKNIVEQSTSTGQETVAAVVEVAKDEELVVFLKHDDILASEARRKVLFLVIKDIQP